MGPGQLEYCITVNYFFVTSPFSCYFVFVICKLIIRLNILNAIVNIIIRMVNKYRRSVLHKS